MVINIRMTTTNCTDGELREQAQLDQMIRTEISMIVDELSYLHEKFKLLLKTSLNIGKEGASDQKTRTITSKSKLFTNK